MADMIARLKVDSSEYDSKIQRAAKGIQHLAEACHNAGAHLNVLEDENREYIQSLGNMATVATTARGKIAELTSAFIDIKSVYNSLSQEEKNGEFGKELNKQLDIMKGRILEGKRELADINNEINGGGGLTGALDAVAGKFGLNIGQLTKFGGAMAAATGALKVAKDAFFQNETNVDDWGRTVRSAEGIYQSFLQSLNSSDFSDFLTSIGKVTQAARDAYNAIDELQTRQTILNPERAKLQARATELKATIRREGKDSAAGQNATQDLKALEKPLTEAWKTEAKLNYNAFEKLVKERLAQGKINLDEKSFKALMNTFSSDKAYQILKNHARGKIEYEYEEGGSYDEGRGRRVDNRNVNQKLLDLFTDEWRKANSGYLSASYNARGSAASVMLSDARYIREGGAGGGGGGKGGGGNTKTEVVAITGSIDAQTKKVQELQKAWRAAADDDSRLKIKTDLEEQQYILDRMTGKEKFDPANMRELTDLRGTTAWATSEQLTQGTGLTLPVTLDIQSPEEKLREEVARLQELLTNAFTDAEREALSKALKDKKGQLDNLTGKGGGNKSDVDGFKNFNEKFSQLNSGVGSIVSGIQQMGVEIPKELQSTLSVLQGISTIMTGVLAIVTLMNAKQTVQTFTNLIPFYAHGGIVPHAATGYMVPGNDHADRTLIAASSGELILNRAQQGVIASQLESGNGGGMRVVGEIQGEKIVLVANRFLKRSGQGELVTWK